MCQIKKTDRTEVSGYTTIAQLYYAPSIIVKIRYFFDKTFTLSCFMFVCNEGCKVLSHATLEVEGCVLGGTGTTSV